MAQERQIRFAALPAIAVLAAIFSCAALAQDSTHPRLQRVSTHEANGLSAREAGRRSGEAAGAAILCYGLRITDRATSLREKFKGADLVEFDAQASNVIKAWESAKACESMPGPNECKVSQQWSCLQALREIGPEGSVIPGLVEPK